MRYLYQITLATLRNINARIPKQSFSASLIAIALLYCICCSSKANAQAAFQVTGMSNSSVVISSSIEPTAGDDRGGIAATPTWVYRVQDNFTARLDPLSLAVNSLTLPRRDGIFSDLLTGQLWTLWNGSSDPVNGVNIPFTVTSIRQMDADLNILGTQVTLSTPIILESQSAIFAGRGFFIVWKNSNSTLYVIDIATGNVSGLTTAGIASAMYPCENWLRWGIAEYSAGTYHILYRSALNSNIMRRNASTSVESTAFTFTNLGDCGNITVSPWLNRWYGSSEAIYEFGGPLESVFSALATISPANPVITSITPMSAGPGQTVTINGTGFTGVSAVNFGGVGAATFTPISALQATAVVHDGASGAVSLTVSATGTGTLAGFTYIPPPVQTVYVSRGPSNLIGSIRTDGTANNPAMTSGNFPRDVFRRGAYIYWANETGNAIGRANADGTSPNPTFITGCSSPNGVYATATHIYWTNYGSTTIGRANIDGTGVNQSFCNTGLSQPVGITIDEVAGQIYWSRTNFNSIGRVSIDGVTGLNGSFITGLTSPGGLLADNANNFLYWTQAGVSNTIQRAQLSTGTGVTTIVSGCSAPVGLATDGSFLYWSNPGTGNIGRSLLSGLGANQAWATGFANIRGVAIGTNPLPAPTITTFAPAAAQAGATITITGNNFTGTTQVLIGGIPAAFSVGSATSITATVPNVCGNGVITVVSPNGTGISAGNFVFNATYVLGQTNFTTGTPGTLNNKFNTPRGLAIDAVNNKLYVADWANNRVLRFSLPITQNSQLPEVVFGQVNFTSGAANGGGGTSATGLSGPFGMSVDASGNLWIPEVNNNRVLMIPSAHIASNGASGTVVLGQPNLTANASGLSSQNIFNPYSARHDAAGNIWVADISNRRALRFDAPLSTFQNASIAIGVPDFLTNNLVAPSAVRTRFVADIAIVGTALYMTDYDNHRILRFDAPYTTGMAASVVLGQSLMTTNIANNPSSLLGVNAPHGLSSNGTDLFVADHLNNRVLVYLNVNSKTSGAAPDAVIGQPNLATITAAVTQARISDVLNVLMSPAGQMFVAEPSNHRVSVYGPTFTTPAPTVTSFTPTSALAGATVTIRGTNFTGTTQVQFGGVNAASFTIISATEITAVVAAGGASGNVSVTTPAGTGNFAGFTFLTPPVITTFTPATGQAGTSITINGNFFTGVTDVKIGNQSVPFTFVSAMQITIPSVPVLGGGGLISVTTPIGTGSSATGFGFNAAFVVGQPNFTSSPAFVTATGLNFPEGVAVDITRGKLYVADRSNNRVLRYAYPVVANTPSAQIVFGQPNMTSGATNNGGLSASSLSNPTGLAVDVATGDLWVSDAGNNRVLRFPAAHSVTTNQISAVQVLGQANFTANGAATSQNGLNFPTGLALETGGRLWVGDYFNNRIIRFDNAISLGNGANASGVLGQANFTTSAGALTQSSIGGPNGVTVDGAGNLYVADYFSNRVLRFNNAGAKPNGANADGVLGQTLFTTNVAGVATMNQPLGVVVSPAGDLFVSEVANNRILVFNNALAKANGASPDRIVGQPSFTTNGGATTQTGMNQGRHLAFVAGDNVLVSSEFVNNRVLLYGNPTPQPAPTLTSFLPTGGAAGSTIVLTGTNFNNASVVQFGGVNAVWFRVDSPTQITAVVGAGASGNVTVTTPGGTTNLGGFTFEFAPNTFTAATPTPGLIGSAYTYNFVANGVPAPTYAVQSGTLPSGLTLSAAGVLSGTPTGVGAVSGSIVVRATNSRGALDCAPFTITINEAPTAFSAQTPPIGVPSVAYGPYSFVANGFPTPTYTVQTGGALPAGLTLSAAGVLSGTPTVGGVFGPYTIRATNGFGTFDTAPFMLTMGVAPTAYSAQTPPSGAVGLSYSYIFTANGLPAPTYSVQSGTLPAGLTLNAVTGELSGTPSATGTFGPIVIRATNIMGTFDTAPFSITVNVAPSAFTAQTPPNGTLGAVYNYSYAANGAPAPTYSLFAGTIPPGVFLNAATGQLFGTPTAAGVFSGIVIRASNVAGAFNSLPATISIAGAPTVFSAAPVSGVVGTPYTFTFSANGFPSPTYSLFSGVLPPGLTLNSGTGELSGTPTMAGTFGVTIIRASNGAGSVNSNSFSIVIAGGPSSPTSFSAASPATGTNGTPYSYTFAANGFPAPTYSIASGALPPGLTLNAVTGELTGTPTVTGSFGPITLNASNGSGTLTSAPFNILINGAPTAFSAQTPGNGVVGTPYTYSFVANGLPAPTYSVLSGTLPTGLTLNASGLLSGTPTAAGTFGPIVVQASNGAGSVNSAIFSITISATGTAPTAFTAQSPPNGIVSNAYAYTFAANGSPAPTFSIVSGAFPPGLTLNTTNGLLSGFPTASGVFGPVTLSAVNGFGSVNSAPFNITVNAAPTAFTAQTPPSGALSTAYSYTFAANGFPAPTYSVVGGTLPPGLTLSASGVLSGTPSAAGTFSGIVIQAQNAFGNVNTVSVSIPISASLIAPTAYSAQAPPSGNLATPYSYTIIANGSPSPTYSVIAGTLPTGLTLNAATGLISGTPTAAGTFGPITIQASNGAGMLNTTPFSMTINQAPPTITNFTPTGAPSGATITINGTNLTGVTGVSFGGVPAASFNPVSATQVTAVVAAGGATGNVNLTTPGGTAVLGVFSFFAPPTITSFTPMVAAIGSTITITGTGFTGATQVDFGGVPAASFSVVSPTQITAVVPLGALNMPIAVTTPAGIGNSAASFMLVASTSQFYYQSGPADNPANWNTLPNGGGLTAMNFTSAGHSFIVSNARTAPFSASATIGAGVTFQVENASTLRIANGQTLDIQGSLRVNNGGRLQLVGTGAVSGVSDVQYLGSQARLEYYGGANRLTSNREFPAMMSASVAIDSGSVRLNASKTLQGSLTLANGGVLNFGMNNRLALEGEIFASNGKFGTDATNAINITGTGAVNGALAFDGLGTGIVGTLRLQRNNRNVALLGSLDIAGSLILNGGTLTVPNGQALRVTNAADTAVQGGSLTSFVVGSLARQLPDNLTPADPRIWSYPIGKGVQYLPAAILGVTTGTVTPIVALEAFNGASGGSSGIGLAGALSKTEYWTLNVVSGAISGAQIGLIRQNLNDSTRVALGTTQSGTYRNVGGALVTLPAGQGVVSSGFPTGAGQQFFALAGAGAAPGDTTPVLTPKITRFSPDRGGAETVVTVIGENLTGINSVAIGTLPVGSFRVLSSTGISITVGNVRTGPIQIGGPNGGTASNSEFTFLAAPVIQSVNPQTAGPGATVTITGENLQNVTTLTFGGITITNFTVNPDGSISFVVPPGAASGSTNTQIRLNTDVGMAQATTNVVFVPEPRITSFAPATDVTGAIVTIRGENFVAVQSVRFGTESAFALANFTRNDSTRIAVIVPERTSRMASEVPITIQFAGGVRVSTPTMFAYKSSASSSGINGMTNLSQIIAVTNFMDTVVANGGEVRVQGSNLNVITDISLRTSVSTGKAEYRTSSSGQITMLLPKQNLLSGTGGTVSSSPVRVVFLAPFNSVVVERAFTIVSSPEVVSIEPRDAAVGEEIVITGTNLDIITAVTIGGTNASFRLEGNPVGTRLIVRMPGRIGNATQPLAGSLVLTSIGGLRTNTGLIINQNLAGGLPSITSFSPASGTGGEVITVTGANLSIVNMVRLGDSPVATFRLTSPTTLQITVPSGVSRKATALIRLIAASGEAVSREPFRFTESLEADSLRVAELLRMMPEATASNLNWSGTTDITMWRGVEIVGNRVQAIRLANAGLRGAIPSGLSALTQLRTLDLFGNALTGTIPASFTNLALLEEFNASRNQLSGTLPGEVLCAWRRLRRFDVSSNAFTGAIPTCVQQLENAETLNLSNNRFIGQIPPQFGAMPNLRELRLNNNQLSGRLPREFGGNTTRTALTQTSKNAASLTQAQTLQNLDISNNQIEGSIPPEWAAMTNMRELNLSNNSLSGEVPRGLGTWTSLVVLRLGNNRFAGELPSGVQWNNMQEVSLENNFFRGALPLELSQASRLRVIRAQNNRFTALPNLTRTFVDTLIVDGNMLEFGSLEQAAKLARPIRVFQYLPQMRGDSPRDTVLERGGVLVLPSGIGGESTVYQWFKDSNAVRGNAGRQSVFRVDSATRFTSGVYFCRATNPHVPNLTLVTAPVTVSVATVDMVLGTPEPITPASGAINVSPNLTLRWTKIEGATDYEIQWWKLDNRVAVNVRTDTVAQPETGEPTYVLRGLERGAEFEWRARALIRTDRGAVSESGNAMRPAYFKVVVPGVDLAFSTVDAGKSTIADNRDVPGGVLINVSGAPLTILQDGIAVISRDSSFRIKTEQVAGIVKDTTLQPNGELALGIEFTPAEAEPTLASLQVRYRDNGGTNRTITFNDALRGRGSALAIRPVDFDTVRVGRERKEYVEVINRSKIHTMQIQAVQILAVRGAPLENSFSLLDATDLQIPPSSSRFVFIRCIPTQEGVRRAGIRVIAVSTKDTSVSDISFTSITAFARLPKPDDAAVSLKVRAVPDTAVPGSLVRLNVFIEEATDEKLRSVFNASQPIIAGRVQFSRQVLSLANTSGGARAVPDPTGADKASVIFNTNWEGRNAVIASFEVRAVAGNKTTTQLNLAGVTWGTTATARLPWERKVFVEESPDTTLFRYTNRVSVAGGKRLISSTSGTIRLSAIAPNPVKELFEVTYTLPESGFITMSLIDSRGNEVQTLLSEVQSAGKHTASFKVGWLATGSYLLKVQSEKEMVTGRLDIIR
jgi:sugar lactone lactonase YvrE